MIENRGRSPKYQELEFIFRMIERGLTNPQIREETQDTEYALLDNRTYDRLRREYWAVANLLKEKARADPDDLQSTWKPEVPANRIEGHKDFLVSGFDSLKFPTSIIQPPVWEGGAAKFKPRPLKADIYLRDHLSPDDTVLLNEEQSLEIQSEFHSLTFDLFKTLNSTSFVSSEVLAAYMRRKRLSSRICSAGHKIYLNAGNIVRGLTNYLFQEEYDGEINDFEARPTRDADSPRKFETTLKELRPTPETQPLVERMVSLLASNEELSLYQEETIQERKNKRLIPPGNCSICGPWGGIT